MSSRIILPIIVAAVVLTIIGGAILLQPKGPEFTLEMQEFGYDGYSGGPTLKAKVGETIKLTLKNVGGAPHEFMIVENKDMALAMMKKTVSNLHDMGLEKGELIEKYNEMHHGMMMDMMAFQGSQVDLQPGETVTIYVEVDRPGTFWYICHHLEGTYPELHQERGMFGQLIVET